MKERYYYLVASLPMLEFGMKMPFSYSDFLSLCQKHLSVSDMETIKRVSILPPRDTQDPSLTLREWKIFDTALRNELAKSRAHKHGKDPIQHVRGEEYLEPFIFHFIQHVVTEDSPLKTEASLDRLRWEKTEELKKDHYFDIDCLITYALQLLILERWSRINSGGGMEVLQGLVER